MKILITGASGFLGTNLCSQLQTQGHELVRLNSKNCDLTQSDSLLNFNNTTYDQIYHLAAWTQAGDFCLYHPGEQWIINQQMNTNILNWWQKYQPQAKFICMGTSCAYDPDLSLVEENYLTGMPISSLFTYAMTKRMLYAGLLALNKQYGLKYLCLVPSTLYGAGYHTDGRQMHFIFDLIRKIIRGKLYGEPVILWGDGTQSRELVFVDDFAKIAIQLAQTVDNDLINIGAGEEFPIRHFAKLICEQVGYDFNQIQFDTSRYVGAKSKCLVVNKLKESLPNLDLTPLELGLTKTIVWFWQEQEKLVPAG
ncbi:NAD-dependent epimerase/dehydratase family protein [Aphanothece sacrum]|uniref:NAD-dependent epimerase/dehydratase n=1 Tax=Aphanothece sacrum FPU1 TaxID=1920663 RepID=A0A401IK33_APHSA|nr:NAD-dependent epimerase/dehydratase family protein [Aphanothece sacrum]GBF81576.1 NAD-dependent epimerase/dehydratase [Aphanothece sacrum FPU1]GBF86967.1 NAD-dependent epimerase/dehydratase [Aphanothece sacrum FPU3]